jgi:hypothetical protein
LLSVKKNTDYEYKAPGKLGIFEKKNVNGFRDKIGPVNDIIKDVD